MADSTVAPIDQPVPRTRISAVWVGVSVAALFAVALIIFIAQNTRSVRIAFLGFHANASLALALIIAAVAGILVTVIIGTARIAQLRRNLRKLKS